MSPQYVIDEVARKEAREAKEMAVAARSQTSTHEAECVIFRAANLAALREIKAILAWCLGLGIVTGISLIGYLWTHPGPH